MASSSSTSESGAIADANPFLLELLGYSLDELLGKQLWEIGLLEDEQGEPGLPEGIAREGVRPVRGPAARDQGRAARGGGVRQQRLPRGRRS